jgi:hypothetical protein
MQTSPELEAIKPTRLLGTKDVPVTVNGNQHVVKNMPVTYELVHKSQHTKLKNSKGELVAVKKSLDRERFRGGELANRLYAAAMIATPALALSAAVTFIPLVIAAFLADTGDEKKFKDLPNLTLSFPSAAHLSKCITNYAVDCLIEVAEELNKAQYVALSCDKGNKKGVGHFVKVLSWWDEIMEKVRTFVLDIDASEGNSSSCGEAIDHSLKKLIYAIKLLGQTTDSGGGGVLEKLAEALKKRNLCQDNYAVANCTLHAIQLTLSNPVKVSFGEGGLGCRTMMQLLHSVYDLQDSFEWDHFVAYIKRAITWVLENKNRTPMPDDSEFEKAWCQLLQFVPNQLWADVQIVKCPAAVLTRWWYCGEAAAYLAENYLVLFRVCQLVINDYDSNSRPNTIASALFSLMREQQLHSDLVFFQIFHLEFLCEHFDWLQEADAKSRTPGFRSHQIAERYYFMDCDLDRFLDALNNDKSKFVDWRRSLLNLEPEQKEEQWKKVRLFLEQAKKSLTKHFTRWTNELLPLALGGDKETSKVVAKRILVLMGSEQASHLPNLSLPDDWVSLPSHDRDVNIVDFERFIVGSATCLPELMDTLLVTIANTIINDIDLWDKNAQPGVVHLRKQFCLKKMALGSNTHISERAVKEAKLVSATGKGEEMRSIMAICRSVVVPFCEGATGKAKATKILELVLAQHKRLSNTVIPDYKEQRMKIAGYLKGGHFKKRRLENKDAKICGQKKNKKLNVNQNKVGVDTADRVAGTTPFGAIRENKFVAPINLELDFRMILRTQPNPKKPAELVELGVMKKVTRLKEHEAIRLGIDMVKQPKVYEALKAFTVLSSAIFEIDD